MLWFCCFRFISTVLIATCCSKVTGLWFFSCPHGNGQGQAGDSCSAFCQCHSTNTCEAGVQKCAAPGMYQERCHATRPCARGFSCQPGIQKCYHVPRRLREPCVAGHECASGLSCEPGLQICFHHPRQYNEPCAAGYSCGPGLSCQPGIQRCLHHPRRENQRCSAGFSCADGFECRLCDKPYATCQLSRVPALEEEDYDRPFNEVAFLVTHNSFSNSPTFAVWARNQRFSVSKQLQDGVRGLMLDIYPGWGIADVRLCHGSCFWGGSTNLVDTLVEIRKFLEKNIREVITIFFEDYLRNPTILKGVFDEAGISPYVLRSSHWGRRLVDWPTLNDMRSLGRLVIFNNNGLQGFPYTVFNMWYWVRENRYGSLGQKKKECIDRSESRWNAAFSDHWSLILVNWFSTAANPLQPCLNSFLDVKDKLITCHDKFGFWANFLAVNYYTAGSGGGAFQAVRWLNDQLKRNNPLNHLKKSPHISFHVLGAVDHSHAANQHKTEEPKLLWEGPGYGSGFHVLSDILTLGGLPGKNIITNTMKKGSVNKQSKISSSTETGSTKSSANKVHSLRNRRREDRTKYGNKFSRQLFRVTTNDTHRDEATLLNHGKNLTSRKSKIILNKRQLNFNFKYLRNYHPKLKLTTDGIGELKRASQT